MEENKNYAFKFDPNNTESVKTIEKKNGPSMTISHDEAPLNMPKNVTLVNRPKTKTRKLNDIGPKSNGFAGVATLATIIAVAGVVVAYLTLRY